MGKQPGGVIAPFWESREEALLEAGGAEVVVERQGGESEKSPISVAVAQTEPLLSRLSLFG
jgi:hypothetical protein